LVQDTILFFMVSCKGSYESGLLTSRVQETCSALSCDTCKSLASLHLFYDGLSFKPQHSHSSWAVGYYHWDRESDI